MSLLSMIKKVHNKTQLVEKGGSSFFLEKGGTITEGGGVYDFFVFARGDYVAELVDSPRKFFKFWLQMVHSESI